MLDWAGMDVLAIGKSGRLLSSGSGGQRPRSLNGSCVITRPSCSPSDKDLSTVSDGQAGDPVPITQYPAPRLHRSSIRLPPRHRPWRQNTDRVGSKAHRQPKRATSWPAMCRESHRPSEGGSAGSFGIPARPLHCLRRSRGPVHR
jgi:hypothetical protein